VLAGLGQATLCELIGGYPLAVGVLDSVVLLVRGLVGLLGLRVAAGDFCLVAFRHRVAPEQVTTPVAGPRPSVTRRAVAFGTGRAMNDG